MGFPETPSFIPSGTNATKVTLIKLTSLMNSFSVFFLLLFFTQDVLSMVSIYYDLPESCDFSEFFLCLFSCVILNIIKALVSPRGLLIIPW